MTRHSVFVILALLISLVSCATFKPDFKSIKYYYLSDIRPFVNTPFKGTLLIKELIDKRNPDGSSLPLDRFYTTPIKENINNAVFTDLEQSLIFERCARSFGESDFVLEGSIDDYAFNVLTEGGNRLYNEQHDAKHSDHFHAITQFNVSVTLHCILYDKKNNRTIWSGNRTSTESVHEQEAIYANLNSGRVRLGGASFTPPDYEILNWINGKLNYHLGKTLDKIKAEMVQELINLGYPRTTPVLNEQPAILQTQPSPHQQMQQQMMGPTIVIGGQTVTGEQAVKIKEYGLVNIQSDPDGAEIYIENNLIGNAPITQLRFEKGVYNITARLKGFTDWKRRLMIIENSTITIKAKLEKQQ